VASINRRDPLIKLTHIREQEATTFANRAPEHLRRIDSIRARAWLSGSLSRIRENQGGPRSLFF
jgi:hypothetical protein